MQHRCHRPCIKYAVLVLRIVDTAHRIFQLMLIDHIRIEAHHRILIRAQRRDIHLSGRSRTLPLPTPRHLSRRRIIRRDHTARDNLSHRCILNFFIFIRLHLFRCRRNHQSANQREKQTGQNISSLHFPPPFSWNCNTPWVSFIGSTRFSSASLSFGW